MKLIRRIITAVGILILLTLIAAIALPIIFKDKIIDRARLELNKRLTAEVRFNDIDISLLRTFPHFGLSFDSLSITGSVGVFDGVPLLKSKKAEAVVDIKSVIFHKGTYDVVRIFLDRPDINIVVLKDGRANYDIVKPTDEADKTQTASAFKVNLQGYRMRQAEIHYTDYGSNTKAVMLNLDHAGKGNLGATVFDLTTKTTADKLSVSYAGIPYLNQVRLNADVDLHSDLAINKFTVKKNVIRLNDLLVNIDGSVQVNNDFIHTDLTFSAPSTDFRQLMSMLPVVYSQQGKGLDAQGRFTLKGFAKGTYNGKKNQYPGFGADLTISNGAFQYTGMPMGVKDIQADMHVSSPGIDPDLLQVNMNRLAFRLGGNPFETKFKLKTPVSDPDVDAVAKGTINLADVAKAIPQPDIEQLSGIVKADLTAKARMSQIDAKNIDRAQIAGNLQLADLNFKSKGQPATRIKSLNMNFTPNKVDILNLIAQLGKSDIQGTGSIDNILAYFKPDKTMTGSLNFSSNFFDANEWITADVPENPNAGLSQAAAPEKPFDRFNFDLNGKINLLKYDKYDIKQAVLSGQFTPNRMDVRNMQAVIGNSDFSINGTITNAFDYLFDGDELGGQINLKSNYLDLNQFMTEEPAKQPASKTAGKEQVPGEVLLVPDLVHLKVNANVKKVDYTNMTLEDVQSSLLVKDRIAAIQSGTGRTLGGQVALAGAYDTRSPAHPLFNLKLEMKQFDFQQSFNTFNTIKKIAPLAQYLTGKFNTAFTFAGEVGQDMTPKLESLNMTGFVETIKALVVGLKPLQEVSKQLNLGYLNTLDLKDTRNWFEVKNGKFHLVDSDIKVRDITMRVGGDHSILNDGMEYRILAKVPRKALEQGVAGAATQWGLAEINKQASKLGIQVKPGDFLNVLFTITGTILQPKVVMKLLSADGSSTLQESVQAQVDATVNKVKDSVRTRANEELDKTKDKAGKVIDKVVDSVTIRAQQELDKAKDKAVDVVKDKVTERLGEEIGSKVGDKVGSTIQDQLDKTKAGQKAKEEAERIKKQMENFNPFGKKKN